MNTESEIKDRLKMILKTCNCNSIGICLKSKSNRYIYDFLTTRYCDKNLKTSTEMIHWLLNDIADFKKCKFCGKPIYRFLGLNKGYPDYCSKCSYKDPNRSKKRLDTIKQKYGTTNLYKIDNISKKIRDTNIRKYGVEYPMQSEEVQQHYIRTCRLRYGTDWASQKEEVKNKTEKTMFQKYGVKTNLLTEENKKRSKETWIKRHGFDNPAYDPKVKAKFRHTMLTRYGGDCTAHSKILSDKSKKTCLQKYGYEYFKTTRHSYKYDNLVFDSTFEVAFYIYLKKNNIKFEYQNGDFFEYSVRGLIKNTIRISI